LSKARSIAHHDGSAITLVYENVGLHIEAPGLADEGVTGDFIQVRNPRQERSPAE
jgi:flagella basal body P-ring formation protein FlgA